MSNKLFYPICLALVLVLAGFAQAELLVNPGFEAGLDSWKTWGGGSGSGAGGWFYNSDAHTTVMEDGTAHGGNVYVETGIADMAGSWWAVSLVFQEHPVTEGQTYQISAWFRDGDADGTPSLIASGGMLQWEWRDAAPIGDPNTDERGELVERVDHSFDLTEEWTYVSATEVAPPGAKGATVIFGTTWGGINLDVDDTSFGLPPVTIPVDPNSDIAAANALANPGDTILFAEGTYDITSQIEVKDGVTYLGAGPGLTIIDGNDTTRAFVAWGDRSFNNGNENPNDSGPKGWIIEGMTIQNCVADTNDRFSYTGSAFDMNDVFAENDADDSGGLDPNEADADSGGIRLPGPDGTEGTEDDDLHRFAHMDTDVNGELSQEELLAQIAVSEDEFSNENRDGGAVFIGNQAVGTIQNCDFLGNHTPIEGDDGGAITIAGLSVVTVNDCWFDGNYAVSPDSVAVDGANGRGGHIKVQGNSASAITPGTTLIANQCVFLNGYSGDDGGAIGTGAVGSIVRLDSCWFEGNTSWDNGNVLFIGNESSHELTVTNCVFVNNVTNADNSPDRMCEVRRNSKFINCTFVGNNQEDQDLIYNVANVADTDANGVDDEMADVTQVINCIFANNVVGNGDDVLGSRNADFTIAATNCLFFGNTLQNGNDADNTQRPAEETGSVTDDPLLDAEYVPGAGSPAIDAGADPATIGITLMTDYNGAARPQGAAYDIGAFEVEAAPPAEQ